MKKERNNKRKLNNAGLTLVEILVAIAILSIAIVPLMYGFVYSARHNAKAKNLQQTSILAHTIIENCKAYSLEEIQNMVAAGTFMPDAASHIDASVAGSGQYTYYFDDVNIYKDAAGNSSSQVYDIAMKIEPYGAQQDIMAYSDMNKYRDAVFMAESTMSMGSPSVSAKALEASVYNWVLERILDKVGLDAEAVPLTTADIDNSFQTGGRNAGMVLTLKREISVSAGTTGASETVVVHYTYSYHLNQDFKYEAVDATQPTGFGEKTVDCNSTATLNATFTVYNNSDTSSGAQLENIYLFYYPTYNNMGLDYTEDKIILTNNLGRDLNVYLMKQMKTDMSTLEVRNAENLYRPEITGSSGTNTIHLYHNLLENIGGGSNVNWHPSYVSAIGIEPVDFDPSATEVESLVVTDSKQLMYKVTVEVYDRDSLGTNPGTGQKEMTTDSLADMDGTFLNW